MIKDTPALLKIVAKQHDEQLVIIGKKNRDYIMEHKSIDEIIDCIQKQGYAEEATKRMISLFTKQSERRLDFIAKQFHSFKGWMDGSMFMSPDGLCHFCGKDVLEHELSKGNDGSVGVTGCFNCHKSYCD